MHKDMTNREIAEIFRQIAAVYQITGKDLFHVRAYENAAQSIETFTTPLKEIWQEGKLNEVPGIGTSFTQYLDELFRTGRVKHFEALMRKAPAGMFPLLGVPGVGPKTALKLAKALKLNRASSALSRVSGAIRTGRLGKLLTTKMAAKLQAALLRSPQGQGRMLLFTAEQIAEDVLGYLNTSPVVIKAQALGSLRRALPTVGDVDIAVATRDPGAVVEHLKKFPHLRRLVSVGEKMMIFEHASGRQVDLKTSPPESWGDMLVHYTGGKLHNINLRTLALDQKKSVSEFGVVYQGKKITHESEEGLYRDLGLSWIPPELREGSGEVEAAKSGKLPKLVELKDIKGDFHVHSNLEFPSSHDSGDDSLEVLLAKASALGYSFLGISDHGPKHLGFSASDRLAAVKKRRNQIEAAVGRLKSKHQSLPKVFIGLEVDILADGTLALEDEALDLLDYAIVSVHAQFRLDEKQQTRRLLRALTHPKAKILGHPTGRHLLERDEIACNWRAVFEYCAGAGKLLEIDAAINRLDLPFPLVRLAGELGCRFVIDTDAHRVNEMDLMRLGVETARKGWVGPESIANTLNTDKITQLLKL